MEQATLLLTSIAALVACVGIIVLVLGALKTQRRVEDLEARMVGLEARLNVLDNSLTAHETGHR